MDWQPNQESLGTLAACLKDSLSGFNKTAQKQAEIVSRNGSPGVGAKIWFWYGERLTEECRADAVASQS